MGSAERSIGRVDSRTETTLVRDVAGGYFNFPRHVVESE